MAPKPKEALGPWLGNRVVDSKGSANSILMPPFSRLRLGTSRSVPKLCRGKPVVICSDSQAALRALDGHLVRSREVLRCRKLLEALSRANSLQRSYRPTGVQPVRIFRKVPQKNGIKKMVGGKEHEVG